MNWTKLQGFFCFLGFLTLSSNFSSCFNSQSSVKGWSFTNFGLIKSSGCCPLLQLKAQWPGDTPGCVPSSQPATCSGAPSEPNLPEPNSCFAFWKVVRELGSTKIREGKDFWNHLPLCHRASERQSPAFCLAWRHLEWDPALHEGADGDAEGIKPGSSKEETHPLRGDQGQDGCHDSPFEYGSKSAFGELLWTVLFAT